MNTTLSCKIRTKSKKTTDSITAEQREEILKQGREQSKQYFLRKIAASLDTPDTGLFRWVNQKGKNVIEERCAIVHELGRV